MTNGKLPMTDGRQRMWTLVWSTLLLLSTVSCTPTRVSRAEPAGRAYAGAPPTIPHEVDDIGGGACTECHFSGRDMSIEEIATTEPPAIPHPQQTECRQCHVPRADGRLAYGVSGFQSARYASRGTRAHPNAPPTIPHRLQNRTYCIACHGRHGDTSVPESPHKERLQCIQCHVPMMSETSGDRRSR